MLKGTLKRTDRKHAETVTCMSQLAQRTGNIINNIKHKTM